MSSSDWYAASLVELKRFLDDLGEWPEGVTVEPGDTVVAAIIAQLSAATVLSASARHVYEAKATLALLEVL